ncbi:uncharacterized protein [Drosophila bipectinata]|uniref:uncharacterized protein n=1 Tax=Drosophila bipectinata TaxID=42026 RepID=UPI001C89C9C1|nr:uncharacterized protein LOC108127343 [Drosophila bipectinata]
MTITSWYKWNGMNCSNDIQNIRPKVIQGFDRLDGRLRAVIQEQDFVKDSMKRKQAGQTAKRKKSKRPKSPGKARAPRAFSFQEIYAENQLELQRQEIRRQRSGSTIQSRPIPDFQKFHKRLEKRRAYLSSLQKVTKLQTPRTLSASLEALKKRKKKVKTQEQNSFIPRINKKSLNYLSRAPFVPRIESTFIQPQPFKLHSEVRAEHRRKFDEWRRLRMMQNWKQKAYDWFDRERREFLKLRRLTNFKASPSPWKKV